MDSKRGIGQGSGADDSSPNHSPHLYRQAGRGSGIPKSDESVIGRDARDYLTNGQYFTMGNDFTGGVRCARTVGRRSYSQEKHLAIH